jgi:hypothetical protein
MLRVFAVVLALGGIVSASTAPQVSPPVCDKQIRPQTNQWGYRLRGDRCEGLYETAVAAGPMRPLSLTVGDIAIQPGSQDLWWPESPSKNDTAVMVTSFNALYRMDTRVRGTTYHWPTEVLLGARIPAKYIGVVAVTRERLKNRDRDVYLPVGFAAKTQARGKYLLKIGTSEDLEDLSYEIAQLTADGDVQRVAMPQKTVPFVYYAATPDPIPLEMTAMPPGLYQVDVDGKRMSANTGRLALSFLLRQ